MTKLSLVEVTKVWRSEKTASGIARTRERSQMRAARRTMMVVLLDALMSRGFTMALYLSHTCCKLTQRDTTQSSDTKRFRLWKANQNNNILLNSFSNKKH